MNVVFCGFTEKVAVVAGSGGLVEHRRVTEVLSRGRLREDDDVVGRLSAAAFEGRSRERLSGRDGRLPVAGQLHLEPCGSDGGVGGGHRVHHHGHRQVLGRGDRGGQALPMGPASRTAPFGGGAERLDVAIRVRGAVAQPAVGREGRDGAARRSYADRDASVGAGLRAAANTRQSPRRGCWPTLIFF